MQPRGHALHDLCQTGINGFAHVGHNSVGLHGQANGDGGNAVHEKAIALRLSIGTLHAGHVSQSHRAARRGTQQQVAHVGLIAQGLAYPHVQALTSGLARAGIYRFAGFLQRMMICVGKRRYA